MTITSTETALRGAAPDVGIDETRMRAGALLEQGTAFTQLEAQTLRASPTAGVVGDAACPPGQERFDVVVIGGGQAGLSVGYHLARQGLNFVILEASDRIGDRWRSRWDSLRLFTPARYNGLDGMRFPAPPRSFPTKDEMADFLEHYAAAFRLPVRTGVKVDLLTRVGDRYVVMAGQAQYLADHVVVASASYQKPRIPGFAAALDPSIRQLHASAYKSPSQLNPGSVLLVGAGNSGAELAMDLARTHRVWLAGRHPGHIPVKYDGAFAYHVVVPIVLRILFHRLLSVDTPMGRKSRPHFLEHGSPLIRVKPADLDRAGISCVARVSGVSEGKPALEGGQRLDVDNVVWCTGFKPGLDWIKLPIFDGSGRPKQYRGVATGEPGLYFAGLAFLHSPSSSMIHGVGRDARLVVDQIAKRMAARRDSPSQLSVA